MLVSESVFGWVVVNAGQGGWQFFQGARVAHGQFDYHSQSGC